MESQVSFYILATIVLVCEASCYRITVGRFHSDSVNNSLVKSGQINLIASNVYFRERGIIVHKVLPTFSESDLHSIDLYNAMTTESNRKVSDIKVVSKYQCRGDMCFPYFGYGEHSYKRKNLILWPIDIILWQDVIKNYGPFVRNDSDTFVLKDVDTSSSVMEHLKFVTKSEDVLKCEVLCDRQTHTLKQIYKTTLRFWVKVKPSHRVHLSIPARRYRLQQQCIHQNLAMSVVTVRSAKMTNQFYFNIRDVNNVKIEIFSATHIKVNSETAAIVWLTVMLLLSFIYVLLSFIYVREMNLLDKWMGQDSAVRNRDLRKNNARKENEQTCETLSKDCISHATPHKSVQEDEQPKKAVGQPHITKYNNEETVATNGNTVNDNEEQTDDINTTETVNFETDNNISECLRPQTALLSMHNHSTEVYAAQEDELMCKICYMEESSVVFLPCGHMLACESCSIPLQRCAVCRAVIKAMLKAERK